MAITINIYYSGESGNAKKFAREMVSSGTFNRQLAGPKRVGRSSLVAYDGKNSTSARKIQFAYEGRAVRYRRLVHTRKR